MTTVLGISAHYHDAAAALVRDGEIVAAVQEERFSRIKHDPRFPVRAINDCLEQAFIEADELDAVVYYDNPARTFDRVVSNAVAVAPGGADNWVRAVRSSMGSKLRIAAQLERTLGSAPAKLLVCDHHMAHAASAFYPSPFDEAAILTIDGIGEWSTCSIGRGDGRQIELLEEVRYPHSLGLLYSAFTAYCGFEVNSGEYKLMGLAPYGRPIYADTILTHLIDLRDDGSFRLDTAYFGFLDDERMFNARLCELFGGPARERDAELTRRHADVAASIQVVIEQAMLRLAARAIERAGCRALVLAGGVALNCVANGRILRELDGLEGLWIQPAAGDAGGALGAALLVAHACFDDPRGPIGPGNDRQRGSYLGPEFSSAEVRAMLERRDLPHEHVADPDERCRMVARALADGEIVGYFTGRMEFGPRALGARSILGDPRRADTQSRINRAIKFRESFRPFAPAVLREHAPAYFGLRDSPYMLLVADIDPARRLPIAHDEWIGGEAELLAFLQQPRSDVPAVTHVDHSARVQTVDDETKPDFRRVLEAFHALTGCPVLVNTSFNVRDEPIVCTPHDAYACFMRTQMDLLVLEDCVLRKRDQPPWQEPARPSPAHSEASSTVAPELDAHARAVLAGPITALAGRLRDAGTQLLTLSPDPACESYFEPPTRARVSLEVFEAAAIDGFEGLLDAVERDWRERDSALVELLPQLRALADSAPPPDDTHDDGEVSPLVYPMY
jgi:carbamoyltransferase